MQYKVYLAGPITGLDYKGATNWRNEVRDKVGPYIGTYSPLRGKEFLGRATAIADHYDGSVMAGVKGINTRDYNDVVTSDAVFVNFLGSKKVSIGTVMEIAWAKAHNVPVVCVMEEDNIHHHAMLDYACGYIVDNLEEGVEVLKALLFSDNQLINSREEEYAG